jgi:hypothetical protein
LIFKDFVVGAGSSPVDGQQVVFDYTGYNESGTPIDSSYRKGRAAEVRLGINGLIPGVCGLGWVWVLGLIVCYRRLCCAALSGVVLCIE